MIRNFNEWLQDNAPELLMEVKVTCYDCGKESAVSNFDYNAGKARCKLCGGAVEKAKPKKASGNANEIERAKDALKPGGYSHRAR